MIVGGLQRRIPLSEPIENGFDERLIVEIALPVHLAEGIVSVCVVGDESRIGALRRPPFAEQAQGFRASGRLVSTLNVHSSVSALSSGRLG